jgi:P27 family predicted phage terminase small subunit
MKKDKKKYPDPPHLTEKARKYYDLLMLLLSGEEGFVQGDTLSLVVLARAFVDYRTAGLELDEQGLFYRTSEMRRVNPAFQVLKESEKTIRELSNRFGLTPKSREKLMKFGGFREDPDALDLI